MRVLTLLAFIIFSFTTGCNLVENDDESIEQKFLFEIQYSNWAWGFSHQGTYIDNNGNVFSFKFDSSDNFTSHEKAIYSEQELKNKFNFNKELIKKFDLNVVSEKRKLINSAIDGAYSDTLNTGADMGQTTYSCFILKDDWYHKKILRCEGDWTYNIETLESDSLVQWLKLINN